MDAMIANDGSMVVHLPGMLTAPSAAALSTGGSGPGLWPEFMLDFFTPRGGRQLERRPVGTQSCGDGDLP